MKKVKVLLATMMIVTVLVGSLGWHTTNQRNQEGDTTTIGMFTTQEDPNPVRD